MRCVQPGAEEPEYGGPVVVGFSFLASAAGSPELAIRQEGYVEPGVAEPEFAGPVVVAFWFLASAARSPSLREPVSGWPQARQGGSTLGSALAGRFLAGLLLSQESVSALSHSPVDEAASSSVLALLGSTADAAQGSGLVSSGSLARHAESAWA
jgi:hypothetical protein